MQKVPFEVTKSKCNAERPFSTKNCHFLSIFDLKAIDTQKQNDNIGKLPSIVTS